MNEINEVAERRWAALCQAGIVEAPPGEVLEQARAAYDQVSKVDAKRRPPVPLRRTALAAIAAAALIVGAVAVARPAVRGNFGTEVAAPTSSNSRPSSSAEPVVAPPSQISMPVLAVDVNVEASLIRPFFLPTFNDFLDSEVVTRVIVGEVESTQTKVEQAGSLEAITQMNIVVDGGDGKSGAAFGVSETGGIVPIAMVQSDLEEKLGRSLTRDELTATVDLRVGGRESAQAGDRVLLALGGSPTGDGLYVLARLTLNDASTEYEWSGKPPNNAWVGSVPRSDAEPLTR